MGADHLCNLRNRQALCLNLAGLSVFLVEITQIRQFYDIPYGEM